MQKDYINFYASPWHSFRWVIVPRDKSNTVDDNLDVATDKPEMADNRVLFSDLKPGSFMLVTERETSKKFILLRAKEYEPTRGKDNSRQPRLSDGKLFMRGIRPGKEKQTIGYLRDKGYKYDNEPRDGDGRDSQILTKEVRGT